jgi:hypothetical protein
VPPDFEGSADWGASFGVTARSGGTIYITSTPSLASDGSIRSTVDADVTYDIGGDANFRSNWSSSSQSGDLELPDLSGGDTPSNGGPTLADLGQAIGDASAEFQGSDLSQRGGSDPSDFAGEIVGHGHRAASGGGGASRLGGGVKGGFNMQAVIGGSGFESLTGDAFAALQGDTGGEGKSEHFFVYAPAPKVEMTSAGLTTSKIVLVHAWDIDGTEDELADTLKNDSVSASLSGQMVLDPDGSTAEIDGDADLTGFTVLAIVASIKSVQDLSGPSSTGYKTRDQTLDYVSIERGKGLGDYRSAVNATVDGGADLLEGDDGAGISSDINARTYTRIKLVDDQKLLYTNHQDIGSWVDEFKTDDKDKMTIILTTHSTIVGNVKGILQSDDSVAWSGLANDETVTHVEYVRNWRRVDSAVSPNESSNYTYVNFRNANFDGKVIQTNVLNAVAGTVTSTFVRSGDVEVHAVSSSAGNHELPTQFEKELESIITGEMPPEVEVWDGTTHPIVSERPSAGYTMAMIGWFGGTAGDSADQVIYFTAGVADSITPTSYWVRHGSEYFWGTHVDENGNAYFVGQVTGTTVSFVMPGGAAVNKLSNSFDDMGRCANWLAKLRHGGCFVAGTKVTVSELPYSKARESQVWSETDWLSNDDYSFSPSPRFGEKGPGDEGQELSASSATTQTSNLLIPIEQVAIGSRVPTKNPRRWDYDFSLPEPNEETWKRFSLTARDDEGAIVEAEFIRPDWWIEENRIAAGELMPLAIEELGLSGYATIQTVEDCGPIARGDGSVITGRFTTSRVNVIVRLTVTGPDGTAEVLEGTTVHPIWSVDRNDWIQLCEIEEGERLQATDGIATVVSIAIVSANVPVYNIEVHGEHVYQVGEIGVLVHNTYAAIAPKVTDPKLGNLIRDLFKGTKAPNPIGTGSTADAVRNELLTGLPTHGRFHSQKAKEYVNALTNWLNKNPNALHQDKLVAQSMISDLLAAIGGN